MPLTEEQKPCWTVHAKDICHAYNNEEFYYMIIDKIKTLETHVEMLAKIIKTRGGGGFLKR